jgi:peptidoglycan/LPS O-acetylase OafA/YrhL
MEQTPTRTPVTWLPCADGLRATAAVLVFFQHASFLTAVMFNSHAGGVLARFDVAPPIFFALSGFLLSRPYVAAILDAKMLPEWKAFYRRRLLRIVPAYWVALTLTYVWLKPESATKAHGLDYPLHYLFLQIYPSGPDNRPVFSKGISPAWTLAVEMAFYASLPLLGLGAAHLVRGLRGVSQKAVLLLGALGAVAVLSLVYRTIIYAADLPLQAALWLPGTMCEFSIGIAAAVLGMWAARRDVARPVADALGRHDLLWWTIAAVLIVFSGSQLGLARGLDHANWDRELFGEIVRMTAAGLLLLPVAFGPQDRGVIRRLLRSWPVAGLGIISYGFFLWHVPLLEVSLRLTHQPMFLDWTKHIGIFSPEVLHPVGLAFGLSVLFGVVSWFALEKPVIRSRRYRGSNVRRAAAVAVAAEPPIVEQAAP